MSACSKDQNHKPNKDLILVCSGTYVLKVKSFEKKEGNFNDEIKKFINGNYIYNAYLSFSTKFELASYKLRILCF